MYSVFEFLSFNDAFGVKTKASMTGGYMNMEQLVEWELAEELKYLKKPGGVTLWQPQIPHDHTGDWTWATAVRSQQMAAWAVSQLAFL
jgi:hypothetical protein